MDSKTYYNSKVSLYKTNSVREERIIALIPSGIRTVLDIGCGQGNLAQTLTDKGYVVSGIDISDEALAGVKNILKDSFCFSVENEEWPKTITTKSYDLIIASELIEHIFSPEDFIQQVQNILTDDGYMIITTPNFLFWKNRLRMFGGTFQYEEKGLLDFGHIRFFTYPTIKNLFKKMGLRVVRENHFYPNLYRRGLNFLGRIMPNFFAYQMIFLLTNEK
jgi:2-polyprenyl-3-methyl-5-hydroxy-6-metoxy-1,4-benzoquinol methylase